MKEEKPFYNEMYHFNDEQLKQLIYEAIVESREYDFDLRFQEKKMERKDSLIKAIFMGLIFFPIFIYVLNKENTFAPKNHLKQIEQLESMSKNLTEFQTFLNLQKDKINSDQIIIEDLQKKRNELEPILKTDQKAIQAILSSYENRQNDNKFTELAISFGLGVIGSYLASFLYDKLNIGRKFRKNKTIIEKTNE